jgi:methyl-accepting chemotaxis protein
MKLIKELILNRPYKRRLYLINPKFQIKFIFYFFSLLFITAMTYYSMVIVSFNKFTIQADEAGLKGGHIFYTFIRDQFDFFNIAFLSFTVLIFIIFVSTALIISHKISGPLYRLRKNLDEMTEDGNLFNIKFRDEDFFQEIPESFNKLVSKVNGVSSQEEAPSKED